MMTLVGAELAALKMEQAIFQVTVSSDESVEDLDRRDVTGSSFCFQVILVNRRGLWDGWRPAENSRVSCWRSRQYWPRWIRFRFWSSMKSIRSRWGSRCGYGNEITQTRIVSSSILHHSSSAGRVPGGASSAGGKGIGESTDIHLGQSAQGDGTRRGNRQNVGRSDRYKKVRETAAELIAGAKGKRSE